MQIFWFFPHLSQSFAIIYRLFVKIILNIGTPYKCRGYKTVSQRPTLRNDIFLPKKDTEKGLNHLKIPRIGCIPHKKIGATRSLAVFCSKWFGFLVTSAPLDLLSFIYTPLKLVKPQPISSQPPTTIFWPTTHQCYWTLQGTFKEGGSSFNTFSKKSMI